MDRDNELYGLFGSAPPAPRRPGARLQQMRKDFNQRIGDVRPMGGAMDLTGPARRRLRLMAYALVDQENPPSVPLDIATAFAEGLGHAVVHRSWDVTGTPEPLLRPGYEVVRRMITGGDCHGLVVEGRAHISDRDDLYERELRYWGGLGVMVLLANPERD